MFKKLARKISDIVAVILKANASPHDVAMGCAIGMFVAFVPIVPVQTVLLLGLMALIKHSNKPAAYAVSWVLNPFTIVPIYLLELWTGALVVPGAQPFTAEMVSDLLNNLTFHKFIHLGGQLLAQLMIGGLFWATVVGAATYFPLLFILKKRFATAQNGEEA